MGFELDWNCVVWDGDLRFSKDGWKFRCFRGTRWQLIQNDDSRKYLKNAYNHTRFKPYYNHTYKYLRDTGIPELNAQQAR